MLKDENGGAAATVSSQTTGRSRSVSPSANGKRNSANGVADVETPRTRTEVKDTRNTSIGANQSTRVDANGKRSSNAANIENQRAKADESAISAPSSASKMIRGDSLDETKPFSLHRGSDESFLETTETSSIPKTASWQTAGLLMIADVVGAGVMSLATAFAQLGWVLAILSLIFWYIVNMYVGLLIGECKEAWSNADSFMDLSYLTYGKTARKLTGAGVYTFLLFVLGDYVLILGETLQMMFYETKQCLWIWTLIGILFLFPLSCIRLLALTNKLMMLNIVTIFGSIVIALGRLGTMTHAELTALYGPNATIIRQTEAVSSKLTLMTFFHSQALFAFAYIGVFIYLEIISEMREPKEFRKSLLWLSGPFQFFVYLLTGSIGYALIGSGASGLLIKQMPQGTAYRISAFLLAIHMVLTFMVKGTILSRAVHRWISPLTAKDFSSPGAHRTYVLVSCSVLVFCFIMANLIPFFDDLTAFLGAMQTPFIGFILPIFFALKARIKLLRSTGGHEKRFMAVIIIWMVLLFFVGVTSSVTNMVNKWKTYGAPFSNC